MAKIFQLEFFIKEMIVWKLPKDSEECDETWIEITVFGHKEVPISGYAFGKSSTLSRGQNFLFTLNSMPSETVSFKIFKKSFNREKKFLGSGRIPIEKIFEDIFVKTFGNPDYNALIEDSDVEIPESRDSDLISTSRGPISRITKDLHPIIGEDSTQWGSICILMRLTSFGDYMANPIHIHQGRSQLSHADQAFYNCTKVDQTNNTSEGKATLSNEKNKKKFCRQHQPMNNDTGLDEKSKEGTSSELDLCPCPPASARNDDCEYEEFKAEINGNVLCVRLPKNTGIVKRVYNCDLDTKDLRYLNDSENARDNHLKSVPIIRGTRKYPAYYGTSTDCPACPEENIEQKQLIKTNDFSLQCTEERILESDNIECPSDVQIFRKNDDPKRDVFVLKIGKEVGPGKQNEIQLEMKTPKNPYAGRPMIKNTTAAQTNDEEFSGKKSNVGMNVDSEESNVGAKGRKVTKGKKGK